MTARSTLMGCAVTWFVLATGVRGAPEDQKIAWSGKDIADQAVDVPVAGKVSVLVFAMADQDRSKQAMSRVQGELADVKDAQLIAVVSGDDAAIEAPKLAKDTAWPGATVADTAYKLSGMASVHVWPTVVILDAQGKVVGHIGGLPSTLARDLRAYVDFSTGRINAEQLKAAMADEAYVASHTKQAAARHVEVAHRLIDRQQYEQARRELVRALELSADDSAAQLTLVQLDILQGKADEAIKRLNGIGEAGVAAWRLQILRGHALLVLEQYDQAKAALIEAVKLNPQPAEAYYLLGRCYEEAEQFKEAADAFRAAYEYAAKHNGNSLER